jgi:hypothetical protein
MRNYCYKVEKNGWVSSDKVDTIVGINVNEISPTVKYNELCSRGIMYSVYTSSSFYEEYDAFYFQAKNAVEAARIDYEHYLKRDLDEQGRYNVYLFSVDKKISFKDAMALSEDVAYKRWKECL